MSDSNTAFASATQLAADIRAKKITSRELLELYLARVERLNPALNAVVVTDLPRARKNADAADAALARGDAVGALHGVPMTVKESFDLAGLPTTWGLPAFAGHAAATSAHTVNRLEAAGAVIFGKTNVPVLLADWQSFNPVYGRTNNPWDLERSPGGSSGGSAAALAAGLCGMELGSDIGGSLRIPAHYCGVYSHKPTYGVVSSLGHSVGAAGARTDISVCGPMARSAADLRLGMNVIAGPDATMDKGWRLALPPSSRTRLADFRVAVLLDTEWAEVDAPVRKAMEAVVAFLKSQGAKVDEAMPDIDLGQVAADTVFLIRGAQSGKLAQADFERFSAEAASFDAANSSYEARFARAMSASHRDWLKANDRRAVMQTEWERFFGQWDVLLCPVASSSAFLHEPTTPRHLRTVPINGRERPSIEQMFWAGLAGINYLPVTVAPIAQADDPLPIGMQIIGSQFGDMTCINFAELLETSYRGFRAPAGFVD